MMSVRRQDCPLYMWERTEWPQFWHCYLFFQVPNSSSQWSQQEKCFPPSTLRMAHMPKAHDVVYFGFFFMNICNVISKVNSTLEIGCSVSSKYLYSSTEYRIWLDSHLLICFLHMDRSSLCSSISNIMHLNGYSVRLYSIFQRESSGYYFF